MSIAAATTSTPSGNTFDGVTGRVFPQGSFKWRYPFVKPGETFTQVLQPIVQLVMAPDCCNSGKIPNEDSRAFEWDDTKLFSPDRFTGIDRVDGGSRVNYGFEWSAYNNQGGRAEVFLGQSYQFIRTDDEPEDSGIDSDLTDIVGRVSLQPISILDASYRFRFDTDTAKMKRQEVILSAGPPEFSAALNYVPPRRKRGLRQPGADLQLDQLQFPRLLVGFSRRQLRSDRERGERPLQHLRLQ